MSQISTVNSNMPHQYQGCVAGSVPAHSKLPAAKRSKKNLTFHSTVTVQPIDCRMSEEEKSRSYYSETQMKMFSLEVKTIQTLLKELPDHVETCITHTSTKDYLVGPALRGMDMELSLSVPSECK